ncbi:hypothetical protein Esti_001976 [Eimeria stiedai]
MSRVNLSSILLSSLSVGRDQHCPSARSSPLPVTLQGHSLNAKEMNYLLFGRQGLVFCALCVAALVGRSGVAAARLPGLHNSFDSRNRKSVSSSVSNLSHQVSRQAACSAHASARRCKPTEIRNHQSAQMRRVAYDGAAAVVAADKAAAAAATAAAAGKPTAANVDSTSNLQGAAAAVKEERSSASSAGVAAAAATGATLRSTLTSPAGGPSRRPPSPGLLRPRSPKFRSRSNSLSPSNRRSRRYGSSSSSSACKINVGPNYQVPSLPPFFLTTEHEGPRPIEELLDPHDPAEAEGPHTPRLVYSAFHLVRIAMARAAEAAAAAGTAAEADRSNANAAATGAGRHSECLSFVRSEEDLDRYLAHAAASWGPPSGTSSPCWPPFSPEFALQLLHAANYNPEKALKLLREPGFSWVGICEAPLRRYDNKWRPKDRRGHLPGAPYPPAHTLKTYTHKWHRHNQLSHNEGGRGAG